MVAKIPWLGEHVSVFCWMELVLVSLEGNAVSSSAFYGVCGFGMTLDSLSLNVQGCVPFYWSISMRCLTLELAGSWVELAGSWL